MQHGEQRGQRCCALQHGAWWASSTRTVDDVHVGAAWLSMVTLHMNAATLGAGCAGRRCAHLHGDHRTTHGLAVPVQRDDGELARRATRPVRAGQQPLWFGRAFGGLTNDGTAASKELLSSLGLANTPHTAGPTDGALATALSASLSVEYRSRNSTLSEWTIDAWRRVSAV